MTMVFNGKFGRVCRDAVVAYFKASFQHLPKEIREKYGKGQSETRTTRRDSNSGFLKQSDF